MASARAAGLGSDEVAKGFQALALTGHHGDDRHAQRLRQGIGIDVVTLIPGDVHHVERQQGGVTQFDDLGREVEVALEVGRVDHHHHQIRGRYVGDALEEDVSCDLFVGRLRAQ